MKRVKILRPFGSYAVGDTPMLFGRQARNLRDLGLVEWVEDAAAVETHVPAMAPFPPTPMEGDQAKPEPFGGKGDHDANGKAGGAKATMPKAKPARRGRK